MHELPNFDYDTHSTPHGVNKFHCEACFVHDQTTCGMYFVQV